MKILIDICSNVSKLARLLIQLQEFKQRSNLIDIFVCIHNTCPGYHLIIIIRSQQNVLSSDVLSMLDVFFNLPMPFLKLLCIKNVFEQFLKLQNVPYNWNSVNALEENFTDWEFLFCADDCCDICSYKIVDLWHSLSILSLAANKLQDLFNKIICFALVFLL